MNDADLDPVRREVIALRARIVVLERAVLVSAARSQKVRAFEESMRQYLAGRPPWGDPD